VSPCRAARRGSDHELFGRLPTRPSTNPVRGSRGWAFLAVKVVPEAFVAEQPHFDGVEDATHPWLGERSRLDPRVLGTEHFHLGDGGGTADRYAVVRQSSRPACSNGVGQLRWRSVIRSAYGLHQSRRFNRRLGSVN
jgi:hypothetical protein